MASFNTCALWVLAPFLLALPACASLPQFHHPNASGHYVADIEQCAPYARKMSGVELYGDADSWWQAAKSRYVRGHAPAIRAVLVLKKTSHMHSGHVAVVKDILGPRDINVTHSNWGDRASRRHIVYDSMRATDVSAANDWSQVRFWNDTKGVLGFPYAAYGFIYP